MCIYLFFLVNTCIWVNWRMNMIRNLHSCKTHLLSEVWTFEICKALEDCKIRRLKESRWFHPIYFNEIYLVWKREKANCLQHKSSLNTLVPERPAIWTLLLYFLDELGIFFLHSLETVRQNSFWSSFNTGGCSGIQSRIASTLLCNSESVIQNYFSLMLSIKVLDHP